VQKAYHKTRRLVRKNLITMGHNNDININVTELTNDIPLSCPTEVSGSLSKHYWCNGDEHTANLNLELNNRMHSN
jgi:hypothetical protein